MVADFIGNKSIHEEENRDVISIYDYQRMDPSVVNSLKNFLNGFPEHKMENWYKFMENLPFQNALLQQSIIFW